MDQIVSESATGAQAHVLTDREGAHVEVLIVGAGLSGICAACVLMQQCPGKSFAILEARDAIGGTWDLFRYPGVRSDSDMFTLGYSFRPWSSDQAFADGPSILKYVRDTAGELGVDKAIRFRHRVSRASWNSKSARWTVEAEVGPEKELLWHSCRFLFLCSGYYDYDEGYLPTWPGMERFAGRVVHPQHWPEGLDYTGKRVVVIGSGATAVTIVPEIAKSAAHVTMLQRSPTWVVALPGTDAIANWLHRVFPNRLAHLLTRWKNVLLTMFFYNLSRRRPEVMKRRILADARTHLGTEYDLKHFTPRYNPWDQRLCIAPDADLFAAIRSGRAAVVTDEIEAFTEGGLKLRSGAHLDADLIVTATGLQVKVMGGMELIVDGRRVDPAKQLFYKGMLFSDVPNLAAALGYTNASWTLKCELTCRYVCRLLNHMDSKGYAWCVPRRRDPSIVEEPAVGLTSGYIQRALHTLPKQGSKAPWRLYQNYALDMAALTFGRIEDGALEFGRLPSGAAA